MEEELRRAYPKTDNLPSMILLNLGYAIRKPMPTPSVAFADALGRALTKRFLELGFQSQHTGSAGNSTLPSASDFPLWGFMYRPAVVEKLTIGRTLPLETLPEVANS